MTPPPGGDTLPGRAMFKRILLATDFSAAAEAAYPWAAQLAQGHGGTVVLVHALEDDLVATAPVFSQYIAPGALDLGDYRSAFRDGARKALDMAGRRLEELGVPTETHLLEGGKPSAVLVQAACDLDCTVMVLSTHGRGGLAHLLLGSTAEKVVRLAKMPVLTVHEGDCVPTEDA